MAKANPLDHFMTAARITIFLFALLANQHAADQAKPKSVIIVVDVRSGWYPFQIDITQGPKQPLH